MGLYSSVFLCVLDNVVALFHFWLLEMLNIILNYTASLQMDLGTGRKTDKWSNIYALLIFKLILNHTTFFNLVWKSFKNWKFNEGTTANVKILYKTQFYLVEIDNISPEDLREYFNLSKLPKFLLDEETNKIIDSRYWKEELEAGSEYRIREQFLDDSYRGIVINSLIASAAVYKMEHTVLDEELVKQYLYAQIENHFLSILFRLNMEKISIWLPKKKKQTESMSLSKGAKTFWNGSISYRSGLLFICFIAFYIFFSPKKFFTPVP